MSKWLKRLLGLAAIASTIAGFIYYFKKNSKDTLEDDADDFEDEDFDLDNDLKPVTDREYVPLGGTPKEENDTSEETIKTEEAAEEAKNSEEENSEG